MIAMTESTIKAINFTYVRQVDYLSEWMKKIHSPIASSSDN